MIYFIYLEDIKTETEEEVVSLPERLFCSDCKTYAVQHEGCCVRCGVKLFPPDK